MRKLVEVIDQILKVSTNENLNNRLEKIKYAIGFTAPELMHMRWDLTSEALRLHIPNPVESDETVKIISIFSTLSETEIRAQFEDE